MRKRLGELTKNEYPEIYLEYVSSNNSKIIIMGNIYSLGQFTGVVVLMDSNGNNEQIGNFQFKRR